MEIKIALKSYFVLVDDFIPVNQDDQPVFGTSRDPNEIWFMLFEKAFAKL